MTLDEVAEHIGAVLRGGEGDRVASGVADPVEATIDEISILTDGRRLEDARQSRAAAFLVGRIWDELPAPQLICKEPRRALALLLHHFHPPRDDFPHGVDPRAAVASDAILAATASVGPFACIGSGAQLGERTRVGPLAFIGARAVVGDRCVIGPAAVLCDGCLVADDVVVGPGAVIGHDGFGFFRDADGWQPMPSTGDVRVGARAVIGANSCVDRATVGSTSIGEGAKLDNLVQVGHNVHVGNDALLCAQVGLAGSVRIGDDAVLAGQVGVADHLQVGERARVGAKGGVVQDVPEGQTVSGYPAFDHRRWLRTSALLPELDELVREVRRLRREVDSLNKERDGER